MLGRPVLVQDPSVEPVTTAEMKTQLRILRNLTAAETTEIGSLIKAARKQVERYLQRALITQTWNAFFDGWYDCMELPYGPLSSVTSVKYFDLNGDEQTLSGTNYHVVIDNEPGRVIRGYDVTFPELQEGRPSAVVIRYVVGYGASGASVPEEIKQGIKLIATDLYENRGTVVMGSVSKIPSYLTDLIHSYKLYQF